MSDWTESVPHQHESADAMLYTYQTQTLTPVFKSHSAASSTELIAAGHCVPVPHVAGEAVCWGLLGQALCWRQYDKSHGSLTEREMRATGNKIEPDKHRLMHTHESTLYTQHVSCIHTLKRR